MLQGLNLSKNQLKSIPGSIRRLVDLEVLNLSHNVQFVLIQSEAKVYDTPFFAFLRRIID